MQFPGLFFVVFKYSTQCCFFFRCSPLRELSVPKGVNCFDYCARANVIATAGKVWCHGTIIKEYKTVLCLKRLMTQLRIRHPQIFNRSDD